MASPWFHVMRARHNMRFPDNYVVFDVETTGLSPKADLIVQVGYCVVADRQPVVNGSTILDWTRYPAVDQQWLRSRMSETKRQIEAKGGICRFTYQRLRDEGCDPRKVLEAYQGILSDARARGDSFLGHNVWRFDIPMLQAHFDYWGPSFTFGSSNIFDTGAMEKAAQTGTYPLTGETGKDFFARVIGKRAPGVCWSLDKYCVAKYGLKEKPGLDMAGAHDAAYDCYFTHLLFEKYRDLSEQPGPQARAAV